MNTSGKFFYLFVLITIAGILLNASYSAFYGGGNPAMWLVIVDYVSTFTDTVLALYLSSKILALPGSFNMSIGLSILFFVLTLILQSSGMSFVFFSAGIPILIGTFMLMMRAFNSSILKTFLLIIFQVIIIILLNLCVFGLYKIFSLFA